MQLGCLVCNLVIRAVSFPVNVWLAPCTSSICQKKSEWQPCSLLHLLPETNMIFIIACLLLINRTTTVCSSPKTLFWRCKISAAQDFRQVAAKLPHEILFLVGLKQKEWPGVPLEWHSVVDHLGTLGSWERCYNLKKDWAYLFQSP